MIKFPNDFLFGSATSATQSEGSSRKDGKSDNIWDYWKRIDEDKFREKIGPETTSDVYKRYKQDVELMELTGHNSFRTSISWSRLIPKMDGKINERARDFYEDYFRLIKKRGIKLFVNLYHFDMPMYLQEIDGWNNKKTVEKYVDYAKKAYKLFDKYVDKWITFNEPIVHVEMGYLEKYHFPCEVNPKKAIQVGYNTQLASSKAIKTYRDLGYKKEIGIILNLSPVYARSDNENDIRAKEWAENFYEKSFLDPSVLGTFPKKLVDLFKQKNLMPSYSKEELEIIRENTVDFLGVNYYQPLRVKENPYVIKDDALFFPSNYFLSYKMPGARINEYRGWEIYPEGVYTLAMNIRDNYKNIKWYLSENGMGVENEKRFRKDGIIEDDYRIDFIKEHLYYLKKAIDNGANCFGYHVWTFIDNWSWLNAYKNRYGLVELDYESKKRTIKKSGYWFKELSEKKGFDYKKK